MQPSFDPVTQIADALRKHAKEIAADLQSRLPGLEDRQRYLKAQKADAKAELASIKVQRNATRSAPKRLLNYEPFVGADFQCPGCWINKEHRVRIESIPSGNNSDVMRCFTCGSDFIVRPA